MKHKIKLLLASLALSSPLAHSAGMASDDPLLTKVMINTLERQLVDGSPVVWGANAWVGRDIDKLWLKAEGATFDGSVEENRLQLLYSRAISPFWDAQIGWRGDLSPKPSEDWLALSLVGLAPYLFDTDVSLYVGPSSQIEFALAAGYEYLFTPHWVLSPELALNARSKSAPERGLGLGLSDLSLGLRLHYEIRREFSPYVGVEWGQKFGQTADLAKAAGGASSESRWLVGLRIWF